MIRSAVTISLVDQAAGGPFVFWDGLADGCAQAAALGFDAVEIFAPGPDAVDDDELSNLLGDHNLELAAVGTGAGMVIHKLSLTDADPARREQAVQFIQGIIDWGARFNAPAIIGSMQGRYGDSVDYPEALGYLGEALETLGEHAAAHNVPLIYEPLNRYETNLCNTITEGLELLSGLTTGNVVLLADLFHMNIEESDLAAALREGAQKIGHVHFVDSNRGPAGVGHLDFEPVAAALKSIDYDGYASAEALPVPSSEQAAKITIESFKHWFR